MDHYLTISFRSSSQGNLFCTLPHEMMREIFGGSYLTVGNSSKPNILQLRPATQDENSNQQQAPKSFIYVSVSPPSLSEDAASSSNKKRTSSSSSQQQKKRSLEIDPVSALALGLFEGQEVMAAAVHDAQMAATVSVEPASIDDSEVAEDNATYIEMTLLQMVNVVYSGQKIPVKLASGTRVMLKVMEITFAGDKGKKSSEQSEKEEKAPTVPKGCAFLTSGCDLYLATKRRAVLPSVGGAAASNEEDNKSGGKQDVGVVVPRNSAVLRLLPQNNHNHNSNNSSSSSPNSLSLQMNPNTLKQLGWKQDDVICFLDLAFWAETLSAPSSGHPSQQQQHAELMKRNMNSNSLAEVAKKIAPPSQRDILSDPTLLRRSAKIKISSTARNIKENLDDFCVQLNVHQDDAEEQGADIDFASIFFQDSPFVKRANTATCLFCWNPSVMLRSKKSSDGEQDKNNNNAHIEQVTSQIRNLQDVLTSIASKSKNTDSASNFYNLLNANNRPIRFSSSLPPSMQDLRQVHSEENLDIISRMMTTMMFGTPSKSNSSDAFVPSKILLTGNRGCSKTSIALRAAIDSNRHIVVFECAASRLDFTKKLPAVILECVLCAPSCLIFEDIENVIARERNLAGGPSAISAPEGSQHNLAALEGLLISSAMSNFANLESMNLWHSSNFSRDYNNTNINNNNNAICILATTPDKEMIHPRISRHESGPCGFSFHYRVSLPGLSSRTKLIEQMIGMKTSSSSLDQKIAQLAAETEHFSPGDLSLLFKHGKQIQQRQQQEQQRTNNKNSSTTPTQDFLDHLIDLVANKTIIPLALSSVNFLNSSSSSKKKSINNDESSSSVLSWKSIGGLSKARSTLNECIVLPCKYPQIFDKLPLKSRSGVLLYGPSGCGKSYIVACLAAAENLNCIVVNGPEILDKYIGQSEAKVREVFERAQAASPCILFLDEFDSVAPQRGNDNTGVTDRVVNQLLCYLDGVESRSKVYVVAASSRPDLIDVALLRPGRLDRHVLCGFPTAEERREILKAHLVNNLPNGRGILENIGEESLDQMSDSECVNWTGADMAALVTSAGVAFSKRMMRKAQKEHEDKKAVAAAAAAIISANNKKGDGSYADATRDVDDEKCDHIGIASVSSTISSQHKALFKKLQGVGNNNNKNNNNNSLVDFVNAKMNISSSAASNSKNTTSPKRNNSNNRNKDESKNENLICLDDFKEAIANTRPSCSEREVKRLSNLYDQFQNRGKRTAEAQKADTRVTMA